MTVAAIPIQFAPLQETLTQGDFVIIKNIPFEMNQNINTAIASESDQESSLVNHFSLIEKIGVDLYFKLSTEKKEFLLETSGIIQGRGVLTTKMVKDYLDNY